MVLYKTFEELIKNTNLALLVIDKQVAYADRQFRLHHKDYPKTFGPELEDQIKQVDAFITWWRQEALPIAWTRMIAGSPLSVPVVEQKTLIDQAPAISYSGDVGHAYTGLKPQTGELELDKQLLDAFSVPALDAWLKNKQIETVILVGGFASRCVFSSAIGAQDHGYHPVLLTDLLFIPNEFAAEVPITNGIVEDCVGYLSDSSTIRRILK